MSEPRSEAARGQAASILVHYLRVAGVNITNDTRAEIDAAIDYIVDAAILEIQERLEQGTEHAQAVARMMRPPIDLREVDRAMANVPSTGPAEG